MTRPEDAELASNLGADAVGMIFYDKSPRNVSIERAQNIIAAINPVCSPVAVVVNPELEFMQDLLSRLEVQLLQFHGDESPEFCAQFNRPYIKALRMQPGVRLEAVRRQYAGARALLLDTYDKKQAGGTGRAFDWSLLKKGEVDQAKPELMLAGGVGPDNAAEAIRQTGIRSIDVNSGVESAPGIKDHDKIRAIMKLRQGLLSGDN